MDETTVVWIHSMLLYDMIRRERDLQIASPAECLDSVDRENRYKWILLWHMYTRRN